MFLDISKIGPEGLSLDHTFGELKLGGSDAERLLARDVRVRGEGQRGRLGIRLEARLEATLELECSRCLEPFQTKVEKDFFLILTTDAVELAAGEDEVPEEHAALFYAEAGKISVAEIVEEQIYLSLPLKPICRDDCRGLCPGCGINRNEGACSCEDERVDPRLAPLLQFKDTESDGREN